MIETSDAEFVELTRKIARDSGFGCTSYKEKCLRRRIAVRMRAHGVHTYGDYARVLDRDAREYERLLDALTINVTRLFRNWETFDAMARLVIPHLWEREGAGIRIWSAGCASGEEAYSLAILLHRHAVARGDRHRLETASVLGTDIDRASLATAEQGTYPESAFADTPAELRQAYFSPTAPYSVRPEIRKLVRFSHHDLLRDPPEGRVHLITCRNVLIYFDRATQEALFQRFHDALVPGGYLVLGKVETLFGPARHRVVSVDARERIFQRPQS